MMQVKRMADGCQSSAGLFQVDRIKVGSHEHAIRPDRFQQFSSVTGIAHCAVKDRFTRLGAKHFHHGGQQHRNMLAVWCAAIHGLLPYTFS